MNTQQPDLRIFIGYDARETVAFHALSHSIITQSSRPVSITPIVLSHISGVFNRERNILQSTDFSFSRFLTPWICNYQGWALFMDCDMLVRGDIAELFALHDDRYAAMCVKHEHIPKKEQKFLNEKQTKYEKKNWSSVILFNTPKCHALTPEYVNSASGLELHQFKWLNNDDLIGELPQTWNHLVGYNDYNIKAKNIHFTEGGPYFPDYKDCEYADEWYDNYREMTKPL